MDETGGYPGMQYDNRRNSNDDTEFLNNATSESSWFGLAISGIKFLLNNQNNHNINKSPQTSFNITTNSQNQSSSSSSSTITTTTTTKNYRRSKLHILGPSLVKNGLYDIPEYESTTSNSDKGSSNKLSAKMKTNHNHNHQQSKLTKQALIQFNNEKTSFQRSFPHYWNQRSSFHSSHHSDKDDNASIAGSSRTHSSMPSQQQQQQQQAVDGDLNETTAITTCNDNEYPPSMTSSLIIHPTQDKLHGNGLKHSHSFPLLHSAQYIQNFQSQFLNCEMIPPQLNNDESVNSNKSFDYQQDEGYHHIETNHQNQTILHPQHVAMNKNVLFKNSIKNVTSIKSWESINSSIGSMSNFSDEQFNENQIAMNEPLNGSVNDDYFMNKINLRQMQSRKSYEYKPNHGHKSNTGSFETSSTGIVHVHKKTVGINEMEWADFENTSETIKIISRPLPKSIRKNKKKKNLKKIKHDNDYMNDEEHVFSDWSNVSSNVDVIAPTTPF